MERTGTEREHLVISNEEITPVDYVQVRRHRRQVCIGVAIACCLGVGLSLAVAIPLVGGEQPAAGGGTAETSGKTQQRSMLMKSAPGAGAIQLELGVHTALENASNSTLPDQGTAVEHRQLAEEAEVATVPVATETETTERHRHTWTWPTLPTDWTRRTLIPRRTTSLTTTARPTPTTASWLPDACPRRPRLSSNRIDIEELTDTVWYELHRIQSYNTPTYVDHVACSKITINKTAELDATTNVEVVLSWDEGRTFWLRERKNITLFLHRNDSSSNDWVETSSEFYGEAQFSFLVRLDGLLLTYECFPSVGLFPVPGYAIRVFSQNPQPTYYEQRIAEALLLLPEVWGLNPFSVSPTSIRQRFCSASVGYGANLGYQ